MEFNANAPILRFSTAQIYRSIAEQYSSQIRMAHLTRHEMRIDQGDQADNEDNDGDWWTILGDKSIAAEYEGEVAVEFTSAILRYSFTPGISNWREEVSTLFQVMANTVSITTNDTCGTHVQISPRGQGWAVDEIKRICKAIIYFESAIWSLLPRDRINSVFARANWKQNRVLANFSMVAIIQTINSFSTMESLVEFMNPPVFESGPPIQRYYAWNFQNLRAGRYGTVEFRAAPGVTTAGGAHQWLDFAASFVRTAMNFGESEYLLRFTNRDANDLATFIDLIQHPDGSISERCHRVFNGRGRPVEPQPLRAMGPQEMLMLHQNHEEHERKNIFMKKLWRAEATARGLPVEN